MPVMPERYFRRQSVSPTQTAGAPGAAVYAGYVQEYETDPDLINPQNRYRRYSEILANTAIVAAGIRYFLDIIANTTWTFTPSPADTSGMYAKYAEEILTKDPDRPWHRIVRRASLYRFYGFGVQEWTAYRRDDGVISFSDIAPRTQSTIDRWDMDRTGKVLGMIQRSPQTYQDIYLPRQKTLYIVDDSLNDSPEGLGLFRHLVYPANRLQRYEQLEGFGYETDLRGIPVGYAPLQAMKDSSDEERKASLNHLTKFLKDHIKNPQLSLLLDSITYESDSPEGTKPSGVKQWAVELLKGGPSQSFKENAAAIERLNREIARILGVEHLLLGSTNVGSFALSQDKTHAFFLKVDGTLTDIRESVEKDLIAVAWMLNSWPDETKPEIKTQPVQFRDIQVVLTGIRDLASAGVPLDPVFHIDLVNEILELLGFSPLDADEVKRKAEEDAALMRQMNNDPGAGGNNE